MPPKRVRSNISSGDQSIVNEKPTSPNPPQTFVLPGDIPGQPSLDSTPHTSSVSVNTLSTPEVMNTDPPQVSPVNPSGSGDQGIDLRPICPYDAKCYRKNPLHFNEMRHPEKDKLKLQSINVNTSVNQSPSNNDHTQHVNNDSNMQKNTNENSNKIMMGYSDGNEVKNDSPIIKKKSSKSKKKSKKKDDEYVPKKNKKKVKTRSDTKKENLMILILKMNPPKK